MKNNYSCISLVSITKAIVIALFVVLPSLLTAQQKPSIQTGVTFQWVEPTQNSGTRPATIQSITVDGRIYSTFVVPSAYEMTRVGPDGPGWNGIKQNASTLPFTNGSDDPTWNTKALEAFQDKNLNHFFESGRNGKKSVTIRWLLPLLMLKSKPFFIIQRFLPTKVEFWQ